MIGLWQVPVVGESQFDFELDEPTTNQLLALRMFMDEQSGKGWEWGDWEALLELWGRESGWRAGAANRYSSARGIPQAIGSLYSETDSDEWRSDPSRQIGWGLGYISDRYGSPSRALAHHDLKGWY
jgi:hypothetical protein